MNDPTSEPLRALAIYYEGGEVDRFWLAAAGLGMTAAKALRVSPRYKTQERARRALVARQDAWLRARGT